MGFKLGVDQQRYTTSTITIVREVALSAFIPGQLLSEQFYHEAVRPIFEAECPGLPHSAALIGYGSDVLGFDTPRSTDHEWGPRVLIFLREADHLALKDRLADALRRKLPRTFRGYSTNFSPPAADGTRRLEPVEAGPINHKVEILTVSGFFRSRLGFDPSHGLAIEDWLTTPEQRLRELTAGRVHHDGLGEIEPIRAKLAYYPRDVWLYRLACQWRRIAQQEAFVGRTGEVGDELGSRLIAAALVRDLMHLAFLLERTYAPYSKWFGTAFARLDCAATLAPHLSGALSADNWPERETHLARAYEEVARLHNALALTPPLATTTSPYYGRPFQVMHADRFVAAIEAAIRDPDVRAIRGMFGAVDQITDSTDVLSDPAVFREPGSLYR